MKARCIAMILAGGRGERLGSLTYHYAKPAVHFGGNHRIIDYTLNNCRNSGIDTIGVLSQYFSADLQIYISSAHDSNGIYMLPARNNKNLYRGTADAVYKNIKFIDDYEPDCVLILAGDHIYEMDYEKMISFHRKTGADVTVGATPVPIKEAPQFGILNADKAGRVIGFKEKPPKPKSNLASMGIYAFEWSALKRHLIDDHENIQTQHDFEKNILPAMLRAGETMYTYKFSGYWRDVGTVESLWKANMDLLNNQVFYEQWRMPGSYSGDESNIISGRADVRRSVIPGRCSIFGRVEHSVLSDSVTVCPGAEVVNSVIMPNAHIGNNVKIVNAVIGTSSVVMDNAVIGAEKGSDFFIDRKLCSGDISLVAPFLHVPEAMKFQSGSHICKERLQEWISRADTETEPGCYRLLQTSGI